MVPAVDNSEQLNSNCQIGQRDSLVFKFDHTNDFTVPITEEFIEHCAGELSSRKFIATANYTIIFITCVCERVSTIKLSILNS